MWLPWERRLQAQLPVIDPAGDDPETNIINFRPPRTIVQEAWRRRAYAVGFALTLFLASLTVLAWQSSPGRTPVKPEYVQRVENYIIHNTQIHLARRRRRATRKQQTSMTDSF